MNFSKGNESFLKAALGAFFVRGFGALMVVFFNFLIARVLPISEAGSFFFSYALVVILWNIGSMGMPIALIRFVSGFHFKKKWSEINMVMNISINRVSLGAFFLTGIGFFLLIYAPSFLPISKEVIDIMKIIIWAVPLISLFNLIAFLHQGLHKPLMSILLQNILMPLLTILMLGIMLLMAFRVDVIVVAYVYLISGSVTLVIAFFLWKRQNWVNFSFILNGNKGFLESANPLFVSSFMGLLVQWSGVLFLGVSVSDEGVALFAVAQRIAMLTSFILIAINLVAAPRFAAISVDGDVNRLKEVVIFCNRIMVVLAVPILGLLLFFPHVFLGIFGDEYIQAVPLLRVLVIGQFINVVTGSVGYLLNMTGHEKHMRNLVLLSGTLAISLSYLLVPIYGAMGAAIATAVSVASQNLLAVAVVRKKLGFNALKII